MSDYTPAPEGKDPELWKMAQKRAEFKSHAVSYVIVNAFLWAIWFFTSKHHGIELDPDDWTDFNIPWPLWTTLGWGIGLAFHFAGVYIMPKSNTVEREYEKLKNQQKK